MMLYFRNPGSAADFVLDGSKFRLSLRSENDLPDGIIIDSHVRHIRNKARVLVVRDSGDVLFMGIVVASEYNANSLTRKYECMSVEGLLQWRLAPRYRYPGGTGLYLSDILSSDPPVQAAGDNQYVMGLLWLAISKISDGLAVWDESNGVATLEGWGARVAGCDIYYNGHLCSEVGLSSITGGTYRFSISGGDLYVRGAGSGDVHGVICADGFAENFVRLGTVATDSEIESAYPTDHQPIWDLIRDMVAETGQYIVVRREDDFVYLDVAAAPVSRGTEAEPYATLREGEDFNFESMPAPQHFPASCVIGLGADYEEVWGQRYGRGVADGIGRAWIEETYPMDGARTAPNGHLDAAVDDHFEAIRAHAPVSVALYQDGLVPGDWCQLVPIEGETFTAQLRALDIFEAGPQKATFGAPDLNLRATFWEREETESIEAYREILESVEDGEAIRYSYFGPNESISIDFETIDFEGEPARILLSIEVVDENDANEIMAAVNYKVTVNGEVIRIPWDAWGPNPITEFDIGPYLQLDGSTETLVVELDGDTSWIADDYVFKVTVTGLGADDPADSIELEISNSTLNDKNTGTYFTRSTIGDTDYYYSVEDMDPPVSIHPKIKVWIRAYGNSYNEYFSDLGRYVYWYGEAATLIRIGSTNYYGSWSGGAVSWRSTTYNTNPNTGNPWEWNEIDAIQAGGAIRVRNDANLGYVLGGVYARLYDAYIEVLP